MFHNNDNTKSMSLKVIKEACERKKQYNKQLKENYNKDHKNM